MASSGEAVSSYRFEAGPTSGSSFFVASPGPTQTSLTATAPDGVFYARVRAVGPCGTSLPSSEVVLTVGSATPPPTPPLNFSASVSGSLVTVSWSAPAFGTAASYRLDAGSGFRGSDLASVTTNTTSLSFSNVPPGTYYLRVYAVGSWGTSSASEELILIVP